MLTPTSVHPANGLDLCTLHWTVALCTGPIHCTFARVRRPELQDKKVFKGVMPFVSFMMSEALGEKGLDALAADPLFDEMATLLANKAYLQKAGRVHAQSF